MNFIHTSKRAVFGSGLAGLLAVAAACGGSPDPSAARFVVHDQSDADLLGSEYVGHLVIELAPFQLVDFSQLERMTGPVTIVVRGDLDLTFSALRQITGVVEVSGTGSIEGILDLRLPQLETLTGFVRIASLDDVKWTAPRLTEISGGIEVFDSTQVLFELPALASVGDRIEVVDGNVIEVVAPLLKSVSTVRLDYARNITLPPMETINAFELVDCNEMGPLEVLEVEALSISGCGITPVVIERLQRASSISISGTKNVVQLADLVEAEWVMIRNNDFLDDGFGNASPFLLGAAGLERISDLTLSGPYSDVEVPVVSADAIAIEGFEFEVTFSRLERLERLDVSGPNEVSFPVLKTLGSGHIAGDRDRSLPVDLGALERVDGDMTFGSDCHGWSALESVGGNLTFENPQCPASILESLRFVEGKLVIAAAAGLLRTMSFPNLIGLGYVCDSAACQPARELSEPCELALEVEADRISELNLPQLEFVLGSIALDFPCAQVDLGNFVPPEGCPTACVP